MLALRWFSWFHSMRGGHFSHQEVQGPSIRAYPFSYLQKYWGQSSCGKATSYVTGAAVLLITSGSRHKTVAGRLPFFYTGTEWLAINTYGQNTSPRERGSLTGEGRVARKRQHVVQEEVER